MRFSMDCLFSSLYSRQSAAGSLWLPCFAGQGSLMWLGGAVCFLVSLASNLLPDVFGCHALQGGPVWRGLMGLSVV